MTAIADTCSAFTMCRSCKAPRTHEKAAGILREAHGTQPYTKLADIFVTIPKEEPEKDIPEEVRCREPAKKTPAG